MNATSGTFQVTSWENEPYEESDGCQLIRFRNTATYQGVIEGSGEAEYLVCTPPDGPSTFVGLERVTGRIAGRTGSVVLQHSGTVSHHMAKCRWVVVPGSGTDDLRDLRGEGGYDAGPEAHKEPYVVRYDFNIMD